MELRGNRFALVDGDLLFDTAGKNLTLFDTAGCSCEQIIGRSGLGDGDAKFGCRVGVMKNWVDQIAN